MNYSPINKEEAKELKLEFVDALKIAKQAEKRLQIASHLYNHDEDKIVDEAYNFYLLIKDSYEYLTAIMIVLNENLELPVGYKENKNISTDDEILTQLKTDIDKWEELKPTIGHLISFYEKKIELIKNDNFIDVINSKKNIFSKNYMLQKANNCYKKLNIDLRKVDEYSIKEPK